MKKQQGFLVCLLAFCLLLSILPMKAFAAEATAYAPKAFADTMQSKNYYYAYITLPYRIYYPSAYDPNGTALFPVMLYLHGAGERGTDNALHVNNHNGLLQQLIARDDCIVIAPQCHPDYKWVNTDWSLGTYDSTANQATVYLDAAKALLKNMIAQGGVDTGKVWVSGISMGGYGAWNLIMNDPCLFTAAIPICGAGDIRKAYALTDMPIWAFHGSADDIVPVSGSREMVNAIQYAGGTKILYTEYPGVMHTCWNQAFYEPGLLNWLYATGADQEDGDTAAPGTCGDNLTWTLDDAGTLTISGEGAMKHYTNHSDIPWARHCAGIQAVLIQEGVTSISDCAFAGCSSLTGITIPSSVTSIGSMAFERCIRLTQITFEGDAPALGSNCFGNVYAIAYYPAGNKTWTEAVRQNYGGTLTWVPYCAGHNYEAVTTAANCIQDGYTTYTCTYCQDSYTGNYVNATGQHTYTHDSDTDCDICGSIRDLAMPTTPMYRLYNPHSGEHFYTGSLEERENLIVAGWAYEGIAWNAPTNSGASVHRMFNPNSGDHHYTMSTEERDMLVGVGWQYEGVCWNSAAPDNLPLYRLYNPNADCGSHHYTGSTEECDFLVSLGWKYEGIGWYGLPE